MKKVIRLISLISALAIFIVLVVLGLFIANNMIKNYLYECPSILPSSLDQKVNYNNYSNQMNRIDVNDRYIAIHRTVLWKSCIVVWDKNRNPIDLVPADCGFRLEGNDLYYSKGISVYKLDLSTKVKEKLDVSTSKFFVNDGNIVWQALLDSKSAIKSKDNINDTVTLVETSKRYWVCDDLVYYTQGAEDNLYVFSLSSQEEKLIGALKDSNFDALLFQGECLLYEAMKDGTLNVINTGTHEQTEIKLSIAPFYWADKVITNCSAEHIFLSFQSVAVDGSFVSNKEHVNNGLWYIDPETYEQRKISDLVFDSLFMTDDYLFGTIGNDLYAVDLETFEVQEAN